MVTLREQLISLHGLEKATEIMKSPANANFTHWDKEVGGGDGGPCGIEKKFEPGPGCPPVHGPTPCRCVDESSGWAMKTK